MPTYSIRLLANIEMSGLETSLIESFSTLKLNLIPQLNIEQFDNVLQTCLTIDTDTLSQDNCIIIHLYLRQLSPKLTLAFPQLSAEIIIEEQKRILDYVTSCLLALRKKTNTHIILTGFFIETFPCLGILDQITEQSQNKVIQKLNDSLYDYTKRLNAVTFFNPNILLNELGIACLFDNRFWHIAKAPYKPEALTCLSKHLTALIVATLGKRKKCLILDCDDVLWGGILGEDGLSGINLGNSPRGGSYYEFQFAIVNLFYRGILIALCSKNNEKDVLEVFKHFEPIMPLKQKHIAASRINWSDKAQNIQAIAKELNIATRDCVFIDDNPFEIELINHLLPDVTTLHFPKETAHQNAIYLAQHEALFATRSITAEDQSRTQMIQEQYQRNAIKKTYTSVHSYLESLNMQVIIKQTTDVDAQRVAQLTQKTNQFNLTLTRYTADEIKQLVDDPNYAIFHAHLADNHGQLGIIAVLILRFDNSGNASITNFLVSCRALGRNVENTILLRCISWLKTQKIRSLTATYLASERNQLAADFYPSIGFSKKGKSEPQQYILDLAKEQKAIDTTLFQIEFYTREKEVAYE